MKRPLILLFFFACSRLAVAQQTPPGFDPQRHMRLSEVKQGMTGYGLSVFRGTKIDRFEVEVISVLRNFNPKCDVILVNCKGANLEHTGGIAGMSGSPIFLKDDQGHERLAGAFAYGWPLTKDPIGGVQPIEYMLAIPATPRKTDPAAKPIKADNSQQKIHWSFNETISKMFAPQIPSPGTPGEDAVWPGSLSLRERVRVRAFTEFPGAAPRLQPLATPLMTSGIPAKTLQQFEPLLKAYNLVPLQAGGAGAMNEAPAKLEPGSSLAVPIMTGDLDMTAIGTVTEVLGDRVIGFGHPFFGEGEVSLPMGAGYIHTVIPNLSNSFKLGSATKMLGTLHADQLVGVAGQLGQVAATIPMEVRCVYTDGTLDQTYHFNAALHPKFTPMLAAMAATTAMSSQRELPQYHTLDYDLTLDFANGQSLHLQNRSANTGGQEMLMTIGAPVQAAAENPFEKVTLKKLTGVIKVSREVREAQIQTVTLPRTKYQPGQTVKAFVTYRPFRGAEAILPLEFALAKDLPEGNYDFAVTDWQQHLMDEQQARPFRFTADSVKDVFAVLKDYTAVRHDALYMRLLLQPDGVAIGRIALPRLPSSRRQVLLSAGRSDTTLFASSTVKIVPTDYVMAGAAHFNITVENETKLDSPLRPAQPMPIRIVPARQPIRPDLPAPSAEPIEP
jgi:hypothetical protein